MPRYAISFIHITKISLYIVLASIFVEPYNNVGQLLAKVFLRTILDKNNVFETPLHNCGVIVNRGHVNRLQLAGFDHALSWGLRCCAPFICKSIVFGQDTITSLSSFPL